MNGRFVERRHHQRINVQVEANLRIHLPEQSFTPLPMHGCTKHVSLGGLRFETRQAPEDYYRVITEQPRRGRVTVQLPGSHEEVSFTGRVVWTTLSVDQAPPLCTFGISFEELNPPERQALQRCLNLLGEETSPGWDRPDSGKSPDEQHEA
jgi:hypothetical protein